MFSTSESQHRAYVVAVLMCGLFPASLVFWSAGFVAVMAIVYLFMFGNNDVKDVTPLQLRIIALLPSLWVEYRFWKLAIKQPPREYLDDFQRLFLKPKTVKGLLWLLVAGSISTVLGVASFVAGWIAIDHI